MKRCSRCIMPDTAQGITFDENGLCTLCRGFKAQKRKTGAELEKVIAQCVEEGMDFDSVVPVSGGRDSSYALYYAKVELGLKPIAVHNDNDFETEIARKNLNAITKALDVPLVIKKSPTGAIRKVVTEKFRMNAPFSKGLVVDQTCEACKYGFESAAYNTARSKGIKLVIWGDSSEESTEPYHRLIKHNVPSKWERLASRGAVGYFKYKYYFNTLKREYGSDSPEGLKDVHLYDYIEWDRRIIVETIKEKLGWTKPEGSATTWRIDCSLVPIVNYLTKAAYGVSKIELGYSNMIRSGKMKREDALRQVREIEDATKVDEIESFVHGLGVSLACVRRVLR